MSAVKQLKNLLRRFSFVRAAIIPAYRALRSVAILPKEFLDYRKISTILKRERDGRARIYYLGAPAHANLGDLAQGVCVRKWMTKHFDDREIIEIETNTLVNTRFSALKYLAAAYRDGDFILFQSGYTTTDLGGFADEMHCAVMKALPNAKMLMMPQTIFFQYESRKKRTSEIYNGTKNLFFLARDRVSFESAKEMFPDRKVALFPDIVTTLIGNRRYDGERDGVLLCCRDDGEKFYSDAEIDALARRCEEFAKTAKTDTTKDARNVVRDAAEFIENEIASYSRYKVIITDRYHGTIFSLVAGTPVVIIKTTDHKVTTGAEWFKGVYDDYVYVADSLDQAYELAKTLCAKELTHRLAPYFETKYYDELPRLFGEAVGERF